MKFFNIVNQYQNYESWKHLSNNKNVIVSKNIKNSQIQSSTLCIPGNNCSFRAKPIKHYRKQYTNTNQSNGYSNQSFVGNLDKPNNNSTTNLNSDMLCNDYHIVNNYILNLQDNTTCNDNGNCFIIKPSNTVLNKSYSSSHKEYLNKKCKTYDKNLPMASLLNNNNNNNNNNNCSNTGCNIYYKPSNKKYSTQGPVSSSARTATIKYNNIKENTNNFNVQCCEYLLKKTNIKLLK